MFYSDNTDLVQLFFAVLGMGFGSVVWAILYSNSR